MTAYTDQGWFQSKEGSLIPQPCRTGDFRGVSSHLSSWWLLTVHAELLTKNLSHKHNRCSHTLAALPEISPLSCLLQHRTREGTLLHAIAAFLQYLPPSFPPFLCFSDSAHKGRPTRSASILHSYLRKPCPESARTGRPSQGLPASVAVPLQPSWSTSYSTFCSVFIHLLSLKDLVQRGPQEMLKPQM